MQVTYLTKVIFDGKKYIIHAETVSTHPNPQIGYTLEDRTMVGEFYYSKFVKVTKDFNLLQEQNTLYKTFVPLYGLVNLPHPTHAYKINPKTSQTITTNPTNNQTTKQNHPTTQLTQQLKTQLPNTLQQLIHTPQFTNTQPHPTHPNQPYTLHTPHLAASALQHALNTLPTNTS